MIRGAGGPDRQEHLFRGPDVPDAGKQLVEIIAAACLLEPLIVHGEALDNILLQPLGGPLLKTGGYMALDTVAHRYDGIQIVMLTGTLNLPATFGLNL